MRNHFVQGADVEEDVEGRSSERTTGVLSTPDPTKTTLPWEADSPSSSLVASNYGVMSMGKC